MIVGQNGHLSTPAISNLIRQLNKADVKCMGAILLTASHNPGGPTEDFGIKYNSQNGGPALETLTNLIYEKSKTITTYKRAEVSEIDLSQIQVMEGQLNDGRSWRVKVEDTCADYTTLMKTLFDFDLMKKLI